MFSIIFSLIAVLVGLAIVLALRKSANRFFSLGGRAAGGVIMLGGALVLLFSTFVQVPPSHSGVVTSFGEIQPGVLPEGLHAIPPWRKLHSVFLGLDVAAAKNSEAGSKDLQTVHADITMNFAVDTTKARELFMLNPSLQYEVAYVVPALYEVFKAVVSHYTAEELIVKRQDVSAAITAAMQAKLAPYYLHVQAVNLTNFGFSAAFNAAIDEKVTASQKAQTAGRNLERVQFEAQQRIAQAEGEAKAIAIQASAIEKQGGQAYIQLKTIEKWNGVLPFYTGGPTPLLNVK